MGKGLFAALCALALWGCGSGAAPAGSTPIDAGSDDGGVVTQSAPPPSVSFTTDRGSLTGAEAFPVQSAQSILNEPTDGGPGYAGFQLSDTGQCSRADVDGGAGTNSADVTHVLSGFVRTFDGTAVQPGTYPIGFSADGGVQAYLQETEFDKQSGGSRTFLATQGQLTVDALQGGHLQAHLDVSLGDPSAQLELPLQGQFDSDTCIAP